jgi:hypothetical protein
MTAVTAVVALTSLVVALAACSGDVVGGAPTATQRVLRVQGNGAGSGAVTAPDASPPLSCSITIGAVSGVCAGAYPRNATVRLVATPTARSTFSGWSGACAGTEDCVLDMSEERTVTASFVPER